MRKFIDTKKLDIYWYDKLLVVDKNVMLVSLNENYQKLATSIKNVVKFMWLPRRKQRYD